MSVHKKVESKKVKVMSNKKISKLEFLLAKRRLEIDIIAMMKKQLHYDDYLLKNDLYLLNHERELKKIEEEIIAEKTKVAIKQKDYDMQ